MRRTGGVLPDTVAKSSDKIGFAPTSYRVAPPARVAVGRCSRRHRHRHPMPVCCWKAQHAARRRRESPATTARNCVARSLRRRRSGKPGVAPPKIRMAARSRRCYGPTAGAQVLRRRRRSPAGCSLRCPPTPALATRRRAAAGVPARWPGHALKATPLCKPFGRPTSCAPGSNVFHGCRRGTSTIAEK